MPQVTIACKLPHGLTMRVFNMAEASEPVMGGGSRTVKRAVELPERVTINGWSHPQNAAPHAPIHGGYALTHGVDKDFWEKWLSQNKDSDIVVNKLIFAHEKEASAVSEAKEKAEVRSGLERLDPNKLPSTRIKKTDTQKAA